MFRDLFGVGLPELWDWEYDRWHYHRQYAEQEMKRRSMMGGLGLGS